jgi:adenylate cyclase
MRPAARNCGQSATTARWATSFSVQDELVQRIVTTMGLQLVLWDRTGLQRPRGTDNLEAYDYDLRGWQYFLKFTREGFPKAREMWEKAIPLDPKYAEAYAGVGLTYLVEGRTFQSTGSSQAFDQAYQWAQKGVAAASVRKCTVAGFTQCFPGRFLGFAVCPG